MERATAELQQLAQQQPAGLAGAVRQELAVEQAQFDFRQGARQEEQRLYELASYASVEASVLPLVPEPTRSSFANAISALHSIYVLAGIDQYYLVNPHFTHPYADAAPLDSLRAYYLEAQRRYGVDASYLAAINYVESNFGRINGPSSAGAEGPMQFLPSTWSEYGQGGNIDDPHAAILAAARYLQRNGAPYDMRNAIWHYNNSFDYVDAVEAFARAFRGDPGWLDRMYYWNTFG